MGESSTPEGNKPYLEVFVISALTLGANHLLPVGYRSDATDIVGFTAAGIVWAIRRFRRFISYRQLLALETKWLDQLLVERAKPGLSRKRQQEFDEEIMQLRREIKQVQRDNIKVQQN
jgi:hypothetical protein